MTPPDPPDPAHPPLSNNAVENAPNPSLPSLVPATVVTQPARTARISFAVLFALATGLTIAVIWPFRGPLFLAGVLASVLYGVHGRLVRLVRGRRTLAAILSTLGLLVMIIGPVAGIIGFAAQQIVHGLGFVRDSLGIHTVEQLRTGHLSPRGQMLADRALAALHISRSQLEDVARRAATAAEQATTGVLENSSRALVHTGIMLIAFYFFLMEGPHLLRWLWRISPLQARHTEDLIAEFRNVSRASVLGAGVSALFQGFAAAIGFLITGVPHAFFFGVITLFASFIPVVGTLLVWVPATVFLWLFGHHGASIILLSWCMVFVVGAEHIGKPMVLRAILHGGGEMHTGIVFLSLLGGIEIFGLIGIILGPLIFAFFLAMVRIYERDFQAQHPATRR